MSSKRDWNDVSDDDSDDSNNISLQQIAPDLHKATPPVPQLTKVVSETATQKKSNNNEQQNLKKLQNCPNEKIWLYAPLHYKSNVQQVDKIIRNLEKIEKIEKFSKGWNILTNRQEAKKFIIQGKKQEQFFIKLYFSNKNDDQKTYNNFRSNNTNQNFNQYNNDKKIKYVPKSPNSKIQAKQLKDFKQPQSINLKLVKHQSYNDYGVSSPTYKNKNNNKYQQKETKYSYKNKKQIDNLKRQNSRESNHSKDKAKSFKPKYVAKKSEQQQKSVINVNEQYFDEPIKKNLSQPKTQIKSQQQSEQNKQQNVQSPQKMIENTPTKNQKKPKKKKKNQLVKDSNNPYSMLGCY